MRRRLLQAITGATLVAAYLIGTAPAAYAETSAYPVRPYRVEYGNTHVAGTITYYNRSIRIVGELKAQSSSGCRAAHFVGFDSDGHGHGLVGPPWLCSGTAKFERDISAPNTPGGIRSVRIQFMYSDPPGHNVRFLRTEYSYR